MWAIDDISRVIILSTNSASNQIFGKLHISWTKLQMQPMPFFTADLSHSENAQQILARKCDIWTLLWVEIKNFRGNFARSKSSKCRCDLTFFSVNLFPSGPDLKSHPFCLAIKIHFERLIHVTCVEMMQKIFHQNHFADDHASLAKPYMWFNFSF